MLYGKSLPIEVECSLMAFLLKIYMFAFELNLPDEKHQLVCLRHV